MINFRKIDITSFKSIYHCVLDFDCLESGLYLLEGINNTVSFAKSNGAGKSTILEALLYVLYGSVTDSSIKKQDYQNKNTKIPLNIILDLDIQNVQYKIERSDKVFKIYKENEDISELTKTDTEKKFQSILQLTKTEFCSFTYIAQNAGSFLNKTPTEKFNVIKNLVLEEELQKIQNKIEYVAKDLKDSTNKIQNNLSQIEGKLSILNEHYTKLSNQQHQYKQYDYSVDEYRELVKSVNNQIDNYHNLENNKYTIETKINNYKQQINKIKQEYEQIKSSICPTCGQTLKDNRVMLEYKQKAKDVKQNYLELKDKLDKIIYELGSINIEDLKQKQQDYNYAILDLKQQNNFNQDNLLNIENERKQQQQNYNNISLQLEVKNSKLQQIDKLFKYFKTDFIQFVQQKFLKEIENYLNMYCYNILDAEFKIVANNSSLDILVNGYPVNYFSGAEQQKINVVFLFATKLALSTLTNKSTNLLILDESLSGSDSEAFENCIEIIDSLAKTENIKTILVSHRDVEFGLNKITIERFNNKTKLSIKN